LDKKYTENFYKDTRERRERSKIEVREHIEESGSEWSPKQKVFGIGSSRTGSSSLCRALQLLGYEKSFHWKRNGKVIGWPEFFMLMLQQTFLVLSSSGFYITLSKNQSSYILLEISMDGENQSETIWNRSTRESLSTLMSCEGYVRISLSRHVKKRCESFIILFIKLEYTRHYTHGITFGKRIIMPMINASESSSRTNWIASSRKWILRQGMGGNFYVLFSIMTYLFVLPRTITKVMSPIGGKFLWHN